MQLGSIKVEIGLAVVKWIIDRYWVWVELELGKSSTFCFTISDETVENWGYSLKFGKI